MSASPAFRNFFQVKALSWCSWCDVASQGSQIEHNGDALFMSIEEIGGIPTRVMKTAILFEVVADPAWVTAGPITAMQDGLTAMVMQVAEDSSSGGVVIGNRPINSAWDSSSSLATMRGLTTGTSKRLYEVEAGFQGMRTFSYSSADLTLGTHGLLFEIYSGTPRGISLATDPVIQLRKYYEYTPGLTASADSTTREAYDAGLTEILAGRATYDRITVQATGNRQMREPMETNPEVSLLKNSVSAISRRVSHPEPWKPSFSSVGSLVVPKSNRAAAEAMQGYPVEIEVSLIDNDGTEKLLTKQILLGRSVETKDSGEVELALSAYSASMMKRQVVRIDPTYYAALNNIYYTAEHPLYILHSLLLNTAQIPFSQTFYNDMVLLRKRFQNVWTDITLSTSDLAGTTVADWWNKYAPMYGLCMAESASGCWSVYHPGVYRASMRLHFLTLGNGKTRTGSASVLKEGRGLCSSSVEISDDTGSSGESSTVQIPVRLPVHIDILEKTYSATGYGEIFHDAGVSSGNDFAMARMAMGFQLMQNVGSEYWIVNGEFTLPYVDMNCGDQILVQEEGESPFISLVIAASLRPGKMGVPFKAIHFPDYLGMHSVFQNDGVLGLWRWNSTPATTNTELGTDANWTNDTSSSIQLKAHWQNWLVGGFSIYHDALLTDTTNYSDTYDIAMAGLWKLGYAHSRLSSFWSHAEFMPIMYWRKAVGDECLAFGLTRNMGRRSINFNAVAIRHYSVMNAGTYALGTTWKMTTSLFGKEDETIVEEALIPTAFAVSWKDTTMRIYSERRLVLEATDATIFDKSVWSRTYLHASRGGPYLTDPGITQTMIASLTHIGQDGWIQNTQRLNGLNGIDPFYGPDDISTLET